MIPTPGRLHPVHRAVALLALLQLAGCPSPVELEPVPTEVPGDPGALVAVSMESRVGVVLDELPAAVRQRAVDALLAEPDTFWIERAAQQLRLTNYRLIFREDFYRPRSERKALPLPPEQAWEIVLDPAGPTEQQIDGHDVLVVGFTFRSTLLSDAASPGTSDRLLAEVGGVWEEPFVLAVDPQLLFQRTGYACVDEDQFPLGSVDAQNAYGFYDDTCGVETEDSRVCHLTVLPDESCVDGLERAVGRVDTVVRYERLAWDTSLADAVRSGEVTFEDGPDLKVLVDGGLTINRVIYRHFDAESCEMVEQCVGAPGWRRLVTFDSHDHNVGGEPLHIGDVDYFLEGTAPENELRGMYEFSACHQHFHFEHYGAFSFGDHDDVQKTGFCLESTDRLSNNEQTPLNTEYSQCHYQGVEAGWGDNYQAGLPCNWVDITDLDTSAGPVTDLLRFESNPEGFLCEGTLVRDENGEQVWEETEFTTAAGVTVQKPACDFFPGATDNDVGELAITIPESGGMVTSPCLKGELGPLRNCGFAPADVPTACAPGAVVTLQCTADGERPQVLRVCETSTVLGGMECEHVDAVANVTIAAEPTPVTFTCPSVRDAVDGSGGYASFSAPVLPADGPAPVVCGPR